VKKTSAIERMLLAKIKYRKNVPAKIIDALIDAGIVNKRHSFCVYSNEHYSAKIMNLLLTENEQQSLLFPKKEHIYLKACQSKTTLPLNIYLDAIEFLGFRAARRIVIMGNLKALSEEDYMILYSKITSLDELDRCTHAYTLAQCPYEELFKKLITQHYKIFGLQHSKYYMEHLNALRNSMLTMEQTK
jgi:hypothetical protein